MKMDRPYRESPDVIVAVAAESASRVYVYGITARGLDFLHDDSGDPPTVCGRSRYGWQVDPARIAGVTRRATAAGLFVGISLNPASEVSQALRGWRDAAGLVP